jgi:hypothetical protein
MTWIQGHPKWVMEGYFSRPMRMPHTRQHGTLQNGKRTYRTGDLAPIVSTGLSRNCC